MAKSQRAVEGEQRVGKRIHKQTKPSSSFIARAGNNGEGDPVPAKVEYSMASASVAAGDLLQSRSKVGGGKRYEIILVLTDRPEAKLTPLEKVELVEKGISKKALQNLKEKAHLDYDKLAKVLNVARGTLISKKGNERFSKDVSDKILGLADIYSYGYQVFEDQDSFNEWIFQPNKAIGGQAPFDLLHTSFGKEEVKNVIGRIDYGVYS